MPPSSLTTFAACCAYTRIFSCSSCRSPPFLTALIMMFSLAMNGSSAMMRLRMTLGYTTMPSHTFKRMFRMASVARNASATAMRLLAESSSVRSNHWVPAVNAG